MMKDKLLGLYQLSSNITLANSRNEIYEAVSKAMKKILNFDIFGILIKEGNKLVIKKIYGMYNPKVPLYLDGEKGITIACARERKTLYVPDVTKDKRYIPAARNIKSELSVPISFGKELFGVIDVESSEYNAFDEEDASLLEILANMVAAGIKNIEYKNRIAESEKKYRSIFENAVEGIYRIDMNGNIVEANPSLQNLFGYSQQELKNMDLSKLYKNPEKRKKFMERIKKEGMVKNFEVEYVRKNGDVLIGNEFAILVEEREGKFIDGIIHDITKLKNAQQEAEFYNSLLRHDLANKLQIIGGYLEILIDELKGENKKIAELAIGSTISAIKLIDNIKKLNRATTGLEKKEIGLGKMVNEIVNEYAEESKKRGVKVNYKNKELKIMANELLREAISNIIWNAIQHSKANEIKVYFEEKNNVCIFIEDNGIGISEDMKKKMFDIGIKGRGSMGSGLGLYLSKKIVEGLNGKIQVESKQGKGTIFKIYLPK